MKNRMLLILCIGNLLLVFILLGCFNVQRSYPGKRFFGLSTSRGADPSASRSDAILRIRKFHVSPRYEGKGFVYRRSDLSYEMDFYNEFLISPGAMIAEEVSKWLTASGLFQYVITSSGLIEPAFYLEGAISALYGDYTELKTPRAILEIRFFLVRDDADRPKVVFGKTYREEAHIDKISPEALTEGWNRSLEHILTRFEMDLTTYNLQGDETL